MTRRRTWWHLEGQSRRPSDYEIATTKLLWAPARGFAVETPVTRWIDAHQRGRSFACRDWDAFIDPRETTYESYTALQRNRENFVEGLLAMAEDGRDDAQLAPRWVAVLDRVFAPLRYPGHALQMLAAYVGSMAPGGRVVVACLLQSADEMRRVQRLAYRLKLLQRTHPQIGADSRAVWERDPLWQPMRELVERLLVVRDFDEAWVALTLAVKPAFDELYMVRFAALAVTAGDLVLAQMFRSLDEDCRWHRDWSAALVAMLAAQDRANADRIAALRDPWQPRVAAAIAPFERLFGDIGDIAPRRGAAT
ncbi:MAG TPA: hypothetical protein VFG69_02755 [Nannocystaceae bacterium]|nr:hypothetical protein [Nannocystaceae bacterium]